MRTLSHIQLDKSLLQNFKFKFIYLEDSSNNNIYLKDSSNNNFLKKIEIIDHTTEIVQFRNGSNTLKLLSQAFTRFLNVAGTIRKENRLHYRENTLSHGSNTLM